jgi:molybdopterin converting factor small subunit
MRVHVKLYGPFSLMTGRSKFSVEAQDNQISVKDFMVLLGKRLPRFGQAMSGLDDEVILGRRLFLLINGKPCSDASTVMYDGDQIQILTPVTGG